VQTLIGHGDDVNDLAVSPIDPTILASASVDCSIRIWSLHPSHSKQPLAAICYGQGHKDQVLTLAYHRKGRFLLSAGMDTKVNLWVVPDNIASQAGTDNPATIHYPHFSTTEVHTDFIDRYYMCVLSNACSTLTNLVLNGTTISSSVMRPEKTIFCSGALTGSVLTASILRLPR